MQVKIQSLSSETLKIWFHNWSQVVTCQKIQQNMSCLVYKTFFGSKFRRDLIVLGKFKKMGSCQRHNAKCTLFIQLPLNLHIPLTFFHQPPMFHDQCEGSNILKKHSWTLWISEKAENKEKLDFQKSSKMAIFWV